MLLVVAIIVFVVSLALLVKSSDWFVESAEKIGLAFRVSPFIIGVVIVGIGTSFPELFSSVAAVFKGSPDVVAANVIGSNVANILLIVGVASVAAYRLVVKRSLIDLDAPLLLVNTALFVLVVLDHVITKGEAVLLFIGAVVYVLYSVLQRKDEKRTSIKEIFEVIPQWINGRREGRSLKPPTAKVDFKTIGFLLLGVGGLLVGANFTIDAMISIGDALHIASSVLAITALAVGTSLPELVVSVRAAIKQKYEIALGNVFGSNIFNVLFITGVAGMFGTLPVEGLTYTVGIPFLIGATVVLVVSGISQRIHIWEGITYLLAYALFLAKIAGLF